MPLFRTWSSSFIAEISPAEKIYRVGVDVAQQFFLNWHLCVLFTTPAQTSWSVGEHAYHVGVFRECQCHCVQQIVFYNGERSIVFSAPRQFLKSNILCSALLWLSLPWVGFLQSFVEQLEFTMNVWDAFVHPNATVDKLTHFCCGGRWFHIPHGLYVSKIRLVDLPIKNTPTPWYLLCVERAHFWEGVSYTWCRL